MRARIWAAPLRRSYLFFAPNAALAARYRNTKTMESETIITKETHSFLQFEIEVFDEVSMMHICIPNCSEECQTTTVWVAWFDWHGWPKAVP